MVKCLLLALIVYGMNKFFCKNAKFVKEFSK